MFLYIIQHGEAKSKEEDPSRPLSDEGIKSVEKTSKYLGKLSPDICEIIHSGKLRAEQTASVISTELSHEVKLLKDDSLSPNDDPYIWVERLKQCEGDIMLVGHLPHLSRLVSILLYGDDHTDTISFKNAGVLCLEREERGNWALCWVVIPEVITYGMD